MNEFYRHKPVYPAAGLDERVSLPGPLTNDPFFDDIPLVAAPQGARRISKSLNAAVFGARELVEEAKARAAAVDADTNRIAAEAEQRGLAAGRDEAQRELARAQQLRDTNSPSDYDKVQTTHQMAAAELAIGRARVDQALAEARQADINLARATIRSPIDGVVIDRRANLGQNVGPGAPGLLLIAKSVDRLRVRASVSETDVAKIQVGQRARLTVDAHRNVEILGRVEKILLNAKMQGNFVTYDVLVAIDDGAPKLLPHMTADVEFETLTRENAWLVPTGALSWWPKPEQIAPTAAGVPPPERNEQPGGPIEGDTAVVWAPTADGRVRPIPLRVGVDDGVLTEAIGEGLSDRMPVVVGTVNRTPLARIIPSAKTLR